MGFPSDRLCFVAECGGGQPCAGGGPARRGPGHTHQWRVGPGPGAHGRGGAAAEGESRACLPVCLLSYLPARPGGRAAGTWVAGRRPVSRRFSGDCRPFRRAGTRSPCAPRPWRTPPSKWGPHARMWPRAAWPAGASAAAGGRPRTGEQGGRGSPAPSPLSLPHPHHAHPQAEVSD